MPYSPALTFISLCWFVFAAYWLIKAFDVKRTVERQARVHRLLQGLLVLIMLLLIVGSFNALWPNRLLIPHDPLFLVLGDVVALGGLIITLWARTVLASNWSATATFKERHELIQHGPYKRIRHPIYTGMMLMIIGTAVVVGTLNALIAILFFLAFIWLKIRAEEQLLLKYFPDAYAEYKKKTGALIP